MGPVSSAPLLRQFSVPQPQYTLGPAEVVQFSATLWVPSSSSPTLLLTQGADAGCSPHRFSFQTLAVHSHPSCSWYHHSQLPGMVQNMLRIETALQEGAFIVLGLQLTGIRGSILADAQGKIASSTVV